MKGLFAGHPGRIALAAFAAAAAPRTLIAGKLGFVDALHNGTGDVRMVTWSDLR